MGNQNIKKPQTPPSLPMKMMVCNFSLAKKIKDAGKVVHTFFYYLYFPKNGKQFLFRNKTAFKNYEHNVSVGMPCELVPAPLSEELSSVMPEKCMSWKELLLQEGKIKTMWYCSNAELTQQVVKGKSEISECNAKADLLVQLIEQKLV